MRDEIRQWGRELGFSSIGFSGVDVEKTNLSAWLQAGYYGEMDYMVRHAHLRENPKALMPEACSIISARMDYFPKASDAREVLADDRRAYVSRYALGRDYHRLMRKRLQKLADKMAANIEFFRYRVWTDSAPIMEVEMARQSGLGWRGKHSLLLSQTGSWFFLGEIFTNVPFVADEIVTDHCGRCRACLDACPTGAIVAPYQVDARRCISYLTIELKGDIPEALRSLIGNRIYGCDDCQLACPWNRFASVSQETDFSPRHGLDHATLAELATWTESEFLNRLAGSPIRRIGYERWRRNIGVALSNRK